VSRTAIGAGQVLAQTSQQVVGNHEGFGLSFLDYAKLLSWDDVFGHNSKLLYRWRLIVN
jgi:hypothetical protein